MAISPDDTFRRHIQIRISSKTVEEALVESWLELHCFFIIRLSSLIAVVWRWGVVLVRHAILLYIVRLRHGSGSSGDLPGSDIRGAAKAPSTCWDGCRVEKVPQKSDHRTLLSQTF